MVIWQPAISHRQTAEREQTGLQKSCCEGIREWKKDWGTCSGMVFVGLQIFLKESKGKRQKKIVSPSKRESKTMRGKGCAKVQRRQAWAIWILIGEGYFRPGIALALWQQIHKALASHQSLSHNWWPFWKQKQQLFSNPGHLHWFKSLSEWFSIDKKPHFLNCEWAVGITFSQAGLSWLLIVEEKDGSRFSGEIMNKMFLVSRVALAWELLLSTVPGPWMRQVTMTPWLLSNMGIINRFLTP